MDRESWRAAVHVAAKSQTRLSGWTDPNWTERMLYYINKFITNNFLNIQSIEIAIHLGRSECSKFIFIVNCYFDISLLFSRLVMSDSFATPWTAAHLVPLSHGFLYPSKNAGVGCYFLFQGIFPSQGVKLSLLWLLHWQVDLYLLSHLGSSKKEWVYVCVCVCVCVWLVTLLYSRK